MFRKKQRMTTKEFAQVFSESRKKRSSRKTEHFLLMWLHQEEKGFSQYAVSVPKKVVKSAVGRNRIKRRVYELLKNCKVESVQLVVVVQKDIREISADILEKELHDATESIN